MPKAPFLLALASLILSGLAGRTEASLLTPLDTRQLVERAERILVGVVEEQTSHWAGDGRSAIVTDVRIRVTQAMRGVKEGEVVTIRRLGGVVGEIGMRVFGEPSYALGEEVLLFAERRGEFYYSVGMAQGKLHVSTENGRKMVRADLMGAELLGPDGKARSASPVRRPLGDLLREVTGLLANPNLNQTPAPTRKAGGGRP